MSLLKNCLVLAISAQLVHGVSGKICYEHFDFLNLRSRFYCLGMPVREFWGPLLVCFIFIACCCCCIMVALADAEENRRRQDEKNHQQTVYVMPGPVHPAPPPYGFDAAII